MCYCVPALLPFFHLKSTIVLPNSGHSQELFLLPRKLFSAPLQLTNSQTIWKSAGMLLPQRCLPWFSNLLVFPVSHPYSILHSFFFTELLNIYRYIFIVCSFVYCTYYLLKCCFFRVCWLFISKNMVNEWMNAFILLTTLKVFHHGALWRVVMKTRLMKRTREH